MSKILQAWEQAYSPEFYAQLPLNWQRRNFLAGAAKAATAIAIAPLLLQLSACQRDEANAALKQHPWPTFAAVQAILFPADGNGPSAKDILEGVSWLDQYAQENYKTAFLSLNAEQQDAVLLKITQSNAGDRWVSALLTYVIEALLSDPVYGGNPQGIGWKWLQHSPGFPRPTQPYFKQAKL